MPDPIRINRPSGLANPPQHPFVEATGITEGAVPSPTSRPGALTPESMAPHDAAPDPHPSDEGNPYEGTPQPDHTPSYLDIRPNPAIHTGTPERKPDNADHGPKYSPG